MKLITGMVLSCGLVILTTTIFLTRIDSKFSGISKTGKTISSDNVRTIEQELPFEMDDFDYKWNSNFRRPNEMLTWDYWFAVDEKTNTYHAYYLQFPTTEAIIKHNYPEELKSNRHKNQWVGHAASKDLITWETQPDALRPIPGTFNDIGIATGSVAHGDDQKWYMAFTSKGSSENTKFGIAMAISDDLINWVKIPSSFISKTFEAKWKGKSYQLKLNADPYLYPKKYNGYYWISINARILNPPEGKETGAVLMLKSRDLFSWDAHKVIAYPGKYLRCETTQHWESNGKWYLYFGGVVPEGPYPNLVYLSDSFDGPYEEQSWSEITLPDGKRFYIGKLIKAFDRKEYFLGGESYSSLSIPYPVSYKKDGELLLSMP
ncbi:hypothetical protein ACFLU5_00090 [Bacteroidota bacterium]